MTIKQQFKNLSVNSRVEDGEAIWAQGKAQTTAIPGGIARICNAAMRSKRPPADPGYLRISSKQALLGTALALGFAAAQAAPVSLAYAGTGNIFGKSSAATGTGFFTSKSGTQGSAIALEDLADFSFVLTFKYDGRTDVLNFGLANLLNFSATLGVDGVEALVLDTSTLRSPSLWGQSFHVRGLGADQAWSRNFDMPGYLSRGQLKATLDSSSQVPEPASLALVLAALASAGLAAHRRRSA
ncbi:hypothetical protein HNP55_004532 [Paucibacter oligotrophus]|uniref:Ice-binding protein C-terminal domain-containing protein n=1 Tax=Roseateles oligotrophus TaxID=1769250 RepID=A0A840LIE5_9BURK|nr:PEP-CTERM sorting domain-containing protein [Roseateles oligotrophus]MBB4845978.1 hypothetical protein [Roseateles oligotrophus]